MSNLPQIDSEGLTTLIYSVLAPLLGSEATPSLLADRARQLSQVIVSIIPEGDVYEFINDVLVEECPAGERATVPPVVPELPAELVPVETEGSLGLRFVQCVAPDLTSPTPAGTNVHDEVIIIELGEKNR